MIEAGNYLAGTSLFSDKIINDSANEMWDNMSDEVRYTDLCTLFYVLPLQGIIPCISFSHAVL